MLPQVSPPGSPGAAVVKNFQSILAGHRVVRRDEAVLALALLAGAVGDHLAVGDEDAARLLAAIVELELPALLPGLRVDRDQETVGRGEIDHVLVDADALLARDVARERLRDICACIPRCRSPLVALTAWMVAPGAKRYITPR